MPKKKAKKWSFKPFMGRLVAASASVLGLAAFGAGISFIFTPVALAAAAVFAAGSMIRTFITLRPSVWKSAIAYAIKKGGLIEAPATAPFMKAAIGISRQLGHSAPPKGYLIGEKMVRAMILPLGLRWLLPKKLVQKVMPGVFAALSGPNVLLMTREAMQRDDLTPEALRFIAAHEMSHMQAKDSSSVQTIASGVLKKMSRALLLGTVVTGVVGLAGISLPLLSVGSVATGLALLTGAYTAGKIGINFASRIAERRADRNALYITRDVDGGERALRILSPEQMFQRPSHFMQLFKTHPSLPFRVEAMRASFNKAKDYPALPGTMPVPAPGKALAGPAAK